MIERKYDIKLSRVTAWNYLRRSNLTPQKPGTLYREQDPEKKRIWLEETYPRHTRPMHTKTNALIFFQDETGVGIQPPVTGPGVSGVTPHSESRPSVAASASWGRSRLRVTCTHWVHGWSGRR